MHCTRCAYPLWNLAARTCPECGTPFRPTEFTFLANAVRFLCPHCRQQYFGTDESGHLVPSTFMCVACGKATSEDEAILLPAEGVREEVARAAAMPWTLRDTGLIGAFLRTCLQALFRPARLARGLGPRADAPAAWAFLWRTSALSGLIACTGMGVMMALFAAMMSMGVGAGPSVPRLGEPTLIAMGIGLGAFPVMTLLGTLAWCVCSHAVLRMLGAPAGSFARTFECFAYASTALAAACVVSPILLCGWFLLAVPPVWMASACTVMVMDRHRVALWPAMLACFAPPAAFVVLCIGTIVLLIVLN